MSQINDIFTGSQIGIFYHSDTKNTDLAHEGYEEIKECAGFPETGVERSTIEVKSFSSQYNRKLVGKMNVSDLTLSVNYIPSDPVHAKLMLPQKRVLAFRLRSSITSTLPAKLVFTPHLTVLFLKLPCRATMNQ